MKYNPRLAEGVIYMINRFTKEEERKEIGSLVSATALGIYAKNRQDAHWYIDFIYDAYTVGKEGVKNNETVH